MTMQIAELNQIARNLGRDFENIVAAGVRWFRILVFPRLRLELGNWVDDEWQRMERIVARARMATLTGDDLCELAVVLGAVPVQDIYGLPALALCQELRR